MSRKQKNKNKPKIRHESTAYTKDQWFSTGRHSKKRRNKPTNAPKQGNNGSSGVPNMPSLPIENLENVSNLDLFDDNLYLSQ